MRFEQIFTRINYNIYLKQISIYSFVPVKYFIFLRVYLLHENIEL